MLDCDMEQHIGETMAEVLRERLIELALQRRSTRSNGSVSV
jgi:hypothetical protein